MKVNTYLPSKFALLVDTLYVYFDSSARTQLFLEKDNLSAEYVGFSKGRDWYHLLDGTRFGLMDDAFCNKYNNYPVLVQYSKSLCHNQFFDLPLKDGDFLSLQKSMIKINRIDISYSFSCKNFSISEYLISPFRKKSFIAKSKEIETLYLGNRSLGRVIRIYNKSLELRENDDEYQRNFYYGIFGEDEKIYTIELELRNKFISENKLDINSLYDFHNAFSFFQKTLDNIKFFENNDENIGNYKNNRYDLLEVYKFHVYSGDYEKPLSLLDEVIDYGLINLDRVIKSRVLKYVEKRNLSYSKRKSLILSLFSSLIFKIIDEKVKELNIEFEDNESREDLLEEFKKREFFDFVELEAKRAFSPLFSKDDDIIELYSKNLQEFEDEGVNLKQLSLF